MSLTRDELQEKLQDIIVQCSIAVAPICGACEQRMERVMELVDQYASAADTTEVWTAAEVAEYLGYRDANAARSTLSRWGIKQARQRQAENGRPMAALYPANAIRAEVIKRGHPV